MSLVIMKESASIRDEGVNKKALLFKIVRRVGTHTDEAARFLIPENANDTPFLGDVYISSCILDYLSYDIKNGSDRSWFQSNWQQKLVNLLFQIHNRIYYCKHSEGEGFNLLVDGLTQSQPDSVQESEEVQRRRAITLLSIREPEITFDIAELRQQLFKQRKHWVTL